MPIYEYKCGDCGKMSEFLESFASKGAKSCKHCGGKDVVKQLSVFSPGIKEGDSKRCHGCSDQGCPHSGGF